MSKDNPFDWSGTDASNSDIGGTDISGATGKVKDGDNAIRAIMAQVSNGMVNRGSDVATASTLDLDAATTPSLIHDLTGTTSVTAVTLASGNWRICRAVAAFTLTAGASLIVNGSTSVNYTTAANDLLFFEGYGSSVVRVHVLRRALPGWEPIAAASFSAQTSVAFTGLSAYRTLRMSLTISAVSSDGAGVLLRTSTDNGSNYDSGAGNYDYLFHFGVGTSSLANAGTGTAVFLYSTNIGNATGEKASIDVTMHDFNQSAYLQVIATGTNVTSSGAAVAWNSGQRRLNGTARNAFQILPDSSTFNGFYVLEGVRG